MGKGGASVRSFFGEHAKAYSNSQSHAEGSDLAALIKALRPRRAEVALDVATGTGFTAMALARLVGHVTGVDMTDEMLAQARSLAAKEGATNVRFELGDAQELAYPRASFDIVTTRRAAHHFSDVPRFLRQARRVLRPGGRLGMVDMSPLEGTEKFSNRIEKLRDRSHVEAFTPTAWRLMIQEAGFRVNSTDVIGEPITFERWLYPVELGGAEERAVRAAWDSAPTKVKRILKGEFDAGKVKGWTKSRIVIVASKTP